MPVLSHKVIVEYDSKNREHYRCKLKFSKEDMLDSKPLFMLVVMLINDIFMEKVSKGDWSIISHSNEVNKDNSELFPNFV